MFLVTGCKNLSVNKHSCLDVQTEKMSEQIINLQETTERKDTLSEITVFHEDEEIITETEHFVSRTIRRKKSDFSSEKIRQQMENKSVVEEKHDWEQETEVKKLEEIQTTAIKSPYWWPILLSVALLGSIRFIVKNKLLFR